MIAAVFAVAAASAVAIAAALAAAVARALATGATAMAEAVAASLLPNCIAAVLAAYPTSAGVAPTTTTLDGETRDHHRPDHGETTAEAVTAAIAAMVDGDAVAAEADGAEAEAAVGVVIIADGAVALATLVEGALNAAAGATAGAGAARAGESQALRAPAGVDDRTGREDGVPRRVKRMVVVKTDVVVIVAIARRAATSDAVGALGDGIAVGVKRTYQQEKGWVTRRR